MASHSDDDHEMRKSFAKVFMDQIPRETIAEKMASLNRRAEKMTMLRENEITAGSVGEEVLLEGQAKNLLVHRLPDDPDGVLRISVGSLGERGYCVFRGEPNEVDRLLSRAINALRRMLAEKEKDDGPGTKD